MVREFIRSLLKKLEANVTAIQEVKDLTKLLLEQLIRSLMTLEIPMHEEEEEKNKNKNKNIAIKSFIVYDESDEVEDKSENDMSLIIRKFKGFLRRKQAIKDMKNFKKDSLKLRDKKKSMI